ncbi:MAG: DUF1272 domain-containing protein [Pseudomonadota bacterium]
MLALRPNCEYCDKALPPESTVAHICTYECTFCTECVTLILHNVCPNCGGGFSPRPIRPQRAHRPGVSLINQPASTEPVHLKYDKENVHSFCESLRHIPPQDR